MRGLEECTTPPAGAPAAAQRDENTHARLRKRPRYERDIRYDETSTRREVSFKSSTCLQVALTNNSRLEHVIFTNCVLINVKLVGCTLSNWTFRNVYLEDVTFEACSFKDGLWENNEMVDVDIAGVKSVESRVKPAVPRIVEDAGYLREHLRSYVSPSRLDIRNLAELPALAEKHIPALHKAPPLNHDASTMTDIPVTKDASNATGDIVQAGSSTSGEAGASHTPVLNSRPTPSAVADELDMVVPARVASPVSFISTPQTSPSHIEDLITNAGAPDVPDGHLHCINGPDRTAIEAYMSHRHEQHVAGTASFMGLPELIRLNICQMVLAPSAIMIMDVSLKHSLARGLGKRLKYYVNLENPEDVNGGLHEEFGWNEDPAADHTYTIKGDAAAEGTGINTAILRVSPQIHAEAIKVLYGQDIRFYCSSQGALSFLHDISKQLQLVKSLEFNYRFKTISGVGPRGLWVNLVETHSQHWDFRRFMNCLVHKCSGLQRFKLRADLSVYEFTLWTNDPHLTYESKLENLQEFSFFKQIARLPSYDASADDGVRFEFSTARDMSDSKHRRQLKQAFIGSMRKAVDTLREKRPRDLAIARACNCMQTLYKQCCYVNLPYDERKKSRFVDFDSD